MGWKYKSESIRQELYVTADYRAEKTGGTPTMNDDWYLDFIKQMEFFFDWLSQNNATGVRFVRPPNLTKLIPSSRLKVGGTTVIYEIETNGDILISGFIW